jgi:hypothetical protein
MSKLGCYYGWCYRGAGFSEYKHVSGGLMQSKHQTRKCLPRTPLRFSRTSGHFGWRKNRIISDSLRQGMPQQQLRY